VNESTVILRQGEVPPSLTRVKVASLCPVLTIAVARRNGEEFWQAYELVPPVFQSSHDGEQLSVVDLIVAFLFG
jgi:hypothetical protein